MGEDGALLFFSLGVFVRDLNNSPKFPPGMTFPNPLFHANNQMDGLSVRPEVAFGSPSIITDPSQHNRVLDASMVSPLSSYDEPQLARSLTFDCIELRSFIYFKCYSHHHHHGCGYRYVPMETQREASDPLELGYESSELQSVGASH